MKPCIVFDIDDTVCTFMPKVQPLVHLITLSRKKSHEIKSTCFRDLVGSRHPLLSFLARHLIDLEDLQFDPEARDFISHLRSRGYRISFVTARAMFADAYERTRRSLVKNGFEFDDLVVLPYNECKYEYAKENLGPVQAVFEDNLRNAKRFHDAGVHVFLRDQPWNRAVNVGTRFSRFGDIIHSFN